MKTVKKRLSGILKNINIPQNMLRVALRSMIFQKAMYTGKDDSVIRMITVWNSTAAVRGSEEVHRRCIG